MRPCVVVPHYHHERHVGAVLRALATLELPTIVVDDGSSEHSYSAVQAVTSRLAGVSLHRRSTRGGKGAAVLSGLAIARDLGFTHAVQVDADGQHDLSDLGALLACARSDQRSLVSGLPVYDDSAPKARRYGRKLSVFWAQIHTWSRDIADPMCGFRVYPVEATLAVADACRLGRGMDFDIEIMVRLHWAGLPVHFVPTPVVYPPGGISHFRMFRDNVRITRMHTRLFLGMLLRAPTLARRALARVPR